MSQPSLPHDYAERAYAGVLGKLIGVYLGRLFEQWSNERIECELGEIRYYVHEKLNVPLVVTDDDITGTFTFFRALADHAVTPDLTSAQIGETWLNYIIPLQSILWWGGIGMSTEYTAWHRLANGIPAPQSDSIALNGKTVAALVAAAFVESDINRLIDLAVAQIPADSLLRRMIADVRAWHAENPANWRATLHLFRTTYGYDKFPGVCHIIPNHALIHLALLHSGGDFSEAQMIVNTAGWDTDCNAARRLRDEPPLAPKAGARFHFDLPGAVQGFVPDSAPELLDTLTLENHSAPSGAASARVLAWHFSELAPGRVARAFTATL